MTEQTDPLMVATNEFAMRYAANLLLDLANEDKSLSTNALDTINNAYQQLLRGANTLRHEAAGMKAMEEQLKWLDAAEEVDPSSAAHRNLSAGGTAAVMRRAIAEARK